MKKALTKTCHKFFANLSNPTRLAIIEKLMETQMSVNELAEALHQEQSMISHNLTPLVRCQFVFSKKQGKKRIYTANHETINTLMATISNHAEKYCPKKGKCLTEAKTTGY